MRKCERRSAPGRILGARLVAPARTAGVRNVFGARVPLKPLKHCVTRLKCLPGRVYTLLTPFAQRTLGSARQMALQKAMFRLVGAAILRSMRPRSTDQEAPRVESVVRDSGLDASEPSGSPTARQMRGPAHKIGVIRVTILR